MEKISNIYHIYNTYLLGLALFTIIASWINGIRMRRRIKRDLGREAKEADLSSIDTWMKVDEVEEKKDPGRAWVPLSSDLTPASEDHFTDLLSDSIRESTKPTRKINE
jgi:hypothetical protein